MSYDCGCPLGCPPGCGCTDCLPSGPTDIQPRGFADRLRRELERAALAIEIHSAAEFMDGDPSPDRGAAFAKAAEIVRRLKG